MRPCVNKKCPRELYFLEIQINCPVLTLPQSPVRPKRQLPTTVTLVTPRSRRQEKVQFRCSLATTCERTNLVFSDAAESGVITSTSERSSIYFSVFHSGIDLKYSAFPESRQNSKHILAKKKLHYGVLLLCLQVSIYSTYFRHKIFCRVCLRDHCKSLSTNNICVFA